MKSIALALLLTCFLPVVLRADLGSCAVYYAEFYLKDGRVFTGCIERSGYEVGLDEHGKDRFCSNRGMIDLIKTLQKDSYADTRSDGGIQEVSDFGKVPVYKNFSYARALPRHRSPDNFYQNFGFVAMEDIVYVDADDIKKINFRKAEYSKRDWLTSEIIVGSAGMADSVRAWRYWNTIVVDWDEQNLDSLMFDAGYGYQLINYNDRINTAELKRLAALKFPTLREQRFWADFRKKHHLRSDMEMPYQLRHLGEEELQRRYQAVRMWFWERKILLVRINGTC